MVRTFVIALVLAGCGGQVEAPSHGPSTTTLDKKRDITDAFATVDGSPVGRSDLLEHAKRNRPSDGQAYTPEERQELVDQVITDEVLFQRALDEGLYHDAKVRRNLINLLLRQHIYEQVNQTEITDDELQAYYDAHKADFLIGERVQARRIVVEFGGDKDAAKAKADRLLAQVKASPARFTEIARTESTGPFHRRGGDMGFVPREGKPGVEPEVIAHVFDLKQDEIAGPFEVNGAFHIVQLVNRREATERTYQQMRGSVLRMVKQEKFEAMRKAYIAELKKDTNIQIDQAKLDAIDLLALPTERRTLGHGHPHGKEGGAGHDHDEEEADL